MYVTLISTIKDIVWPISIFCIQKLQTCVFSIGSDIIIVVTKDGLTLHLKDPSRCLCFGHSSNVPLTIHLLLHEQPKIHGVMQV